VGELTEALKPYEASVVHGSSNNGAFLRLDFAATEQAREAQARTRAVLNPTEDKASCSSRGSSFDREGDGDPIPAATTGSVADE
jgi:hypothetical protein